MNKMLSLSKEDREKGIYAASTGNHGAAVAYACKKLEVPCIIYVPENSSEAKLANMKSFGAEIMVYGKDCMDGEIKAREVASSSGGIYLSPYNDNQVVAGQGTIAVEIISQLGDPPDCIYVAVGGGGLIAGILTYMKNLWPETKIIGVEPEDADAMSKSLKENKIIELENVGLFADGVAVKKVGKLTFEITKKYVDKIITVNNDEICAAIKDVFEDTRSILEPAGALSIAGMKKDIIEEKHNQLNLVSIACGANMNFERLRFVAERAELGEYKETMLAVEIPEKAGSLIDLCKLLKERNLTEFSYRMSNSKNAQIFIGLQVNGLEDKNLLINDFNKSKYKYIDISDDELSKNHLRHMVGGRLPYGISNLSNNNLTEILYRFEFPERPGALMKFLKNMKPDWSISIFHYRNHGADVGRIVIGVLINESYIQDWYKFVNDLGYKYWDETNNKTYKLFLGAST